MERVRFPGVDCNGDQDLASPSLEPDLDPGSSSLRGRQKWVPACLGSNHATDWRPVNGVVSTVDPGFSESVVAITSSIHAMETGINHPPYKPLGLWKNFTLLFT